MPAPDEAPLSPTKEHQQVTKELQSEISELQSEQGQVPLKHVYPEPQPKVVLPTAEDIEQEKQHESLITGIETFNRHSLTEIEPEIKDHLPTKEEITEEREALKVLATRDKVKELAAKFDHNALKKTQTKVSHQPLVDTTADS